MSMRFVFQRLLWQLVAAVMVVALANAAGQQAQTGEAAPASHVKLLDRLVAAYPAFLRSHDGKTLIWKDGTRMRFDDGQSAKSLDQLLNSPDLEDQFYAPYLTGDKGLAPARNIDPGRVRFQPLFTKMYGDCRKGEVAKNLKTIIWLPRHGGRKVRVTSINNVAANLQKISRELDKLLDTKPEFKKFLAPMSGTYNCRKIAGTNRYSVHAYGAAVDINVKQANYWRWSKPGKGGLYPWRNKVPLAIVKIFENHGFIWGGKWYHYDTMHFEYRPELLGAAVR